MRRIDTRRLVTVCPLAKRNSDHGVVLLCIDDDRAMLECERAFLETFGHTVLIASTGSEGLKLAAMHKIDIAVVDYLMPEMDGHEFAVALKHMKPQVPIIMLSAALEFPKQISEVIDALVAKDNLSLQLLTEIARLSGGEPRIGLL